MLLPWKLSFGGVLQVEVHHLAAHFFSRQQMPMMSGTLRLVVTLRSLSCDVHHGRWRMPPYARATRNRCSRLALTQQVASRHHSSVASSSRMLLDALSPEYQLLQQSLVPTLHFQKSLPRLPIPRLEKTCQRYLSALEPLVSADQLEQTRKIVNAFRDSEGPGG